MLSISTETAPLAASSPQVCITTASKFALSDGGITMVGQTRFLESRQIDNGTSASIRQRPDQLDGNAQTAEVALSRKIHLVLAWAFQTDPTTESPAPCPRMMKWPRIAAALALVPLLVCIPAHALSLKDWEAKPELDQPD
jgi:hypothetical protein